MAVLACVHGWSTRCSTIGPSVSAGTNDSAPTSSTTRTSSTTNSGPVVGSVPDDGGTIFFLASEPAIASTGITIQNRATNMTMPPAVAMNVPLPVNPPNAEPLLLPCEMNAYSTSENPCGPWLAIALL